MLRTNVQSIQLLQVGSFWAGILICLSLVINFIHRQSFLHKNLYWPVIVNNRCKVQFINCCPYRIQSTNNILHKKFLNEVLWQTHLEKRVDCGTQKIVWKVQQLSNMSTDHWSFCSCQSTRSWLTRCSLKVQITTNVIHIIHISQLFLKELWHEIHHNSNVENCCQVE